MSHVGGVVDITLGKLLTVNLFMVVVFLLVDSGSQVVVDEPAEVEGVLRLCLRFHHMSDKSYKINLHWKYFSSPNS